MSDVERSAPRGAIFLSYASQDKAAASRLRDALQAAGLEVWFDVNELRGGDAWDQKIRRQIKECALFVPLITATTNARPEGYFRLEWKLAVDRSHLLADDHPFLFPIVLGDLDEATARVPDKFRDVQWTRLRLDETPAEVATRIQRLLGGGVDEPVRERRGSRPAQATRAEKAGVMRWWWLIFPIFGMAMAFTGMFREREPRRARSQPEKPVAQAVSEARQEGHASLAAGKPVAGSVVPEIEANSVAVLAFTNLSEDKANEYFSDGISEELLNVLVKIPDLKVAARTSTFYFKGKEAPLADIARQLGVAYVVEGSVRKAGSKVRITAQLTKAADGFQVWSDTFTREVQDIFAVQDEIAGLIARHISPVLAPPKPAASRSFSPEAVQEYLAGNAAYAKAGMANLREAVVHFEAAVAAEPTFAAGWTQLASAYTRLGRWGGVPSLRAWQSARAAIDRAQALEPDSPEMLVVLGWVRRTAEWDWPGAEQAFSRALALRPNQPEMLAGAAVLSFNLGRTEEAFRLGRQAAQLDPLNPGTQIDLALMFFFSGNWAESERAARRALELAPNGTGYHSILAWSLIRQRRYAEAEAEIAREKDPVEINTATGLLALARGQPDVARARLARLDELAVTDPDAADLQHAIAWLNVGLGDHDRAFATLEKARASRDPSLAWLRNYADFSPLYGDPRWEELLRKVGLENHEKTQTESSDHLSAAR